MGARDGNIFLLKEEQKGKFTIQKLINDNEIYGNSLLGLEKYKGYLILITEKGINFYHLKTKKNIFLDEEMGVEYKNVFSSTVYKNFLKLATDDGIYDVNINQWVNQETENDFNLFLSNLVINEKTVVKNYTNLKYNENRISIEFDSNDNLYPNKLFFRYKLNGLNKSTWTKWSRDSKAVFPYLPSGHYNLQVQAKDLSTGEVKTFQLFTFSIATPFWRNTYVLIASGIILFLLLWIYFKYKIKKVKQREQEIASYEKRIVETKLEALQSQMNPHFIFNSLNVIQNNIINQDVENSLSYVSNFSRLMRKTLEHSSQYFISVDEELDFIQLYIKTLIIP